MLSETEINPKRFFYHGTSSKMESFKDPSAWKPFFVTDSIEYAVEYSKAKQSDLDRTTFQQGVSNESGYVYEAALDFDKVNYMDMNKESDVKGLATYYPDYVMANFLSKEYSTWAVMKYLNKYLYVLYSLDLNFDEFKNYLERSQFEDAFGTEFFLKGMSELIQMQKQILNLVYAKPMKSEEDCLYTLISTLNLYIEKLGFNSFMNTERIEVCPESFKYGTALGLFSRDCIKDLALVSANS